MIGMICKVWRNKMTVCDFLKQNSLPGWAYRHHAYKAMMLQAFTLSLKIYNQSLIFISFQHIDLDAW